MRGSNFFFNTVGPKIFEFLKTPIFITITL